MTAIPQSASSRLITDRIMAPLRQVAQRQWYVLAAVGVLKTLIAGLMAILVTAMLLGFFQNLWAPVRIAMALVTWMVVVGSAIRYLRPALHRWSLDRAALQVEHDHPAMQERISSAIELAGEPDSAFQGSPELVAHLIRQAEVDAQSVKPKEVVRTDGITRWTLLFVPVLLAWMVVAVMPSTSKNALGGLLRVLMPWKNQLPAMFTSVAVKPGDITLVQGDLLDITAHVSFDSGNGDAGSATLVRQFDNGQRLTDDMEKLGPRDYRFHFEGVQQTFAYKVVTGQGESQLFHATVHPRPTITGVTVRCDFPAYTGLASTVETGKDGAIEALVGTRVTLTVRTALPIETDKSHVVLDEGTQEQLILPLRLVQPDKPEYEAQLVVNHNGEYKIQLTNAFDLTNNEEQPRSIVASPDEVPTIVIRSPGDNVTVRPDDTVPVKYVASDDFGVAKLEAVLQIDNHEPRTVPIAFKTADKHNVTGPAYVINVADVLATEKSGRAEHITYQLKVTDNRDPDPQFSFSTKQTLRISAQEVASFAAKQDKKMAADLMQAIEKAIHDLDASRNRVQVARDRDPKSQLEVYWKKELHIAADQLPRTMKNLLAAADEAKDTVYQDVAMTVRKIAEHPIRAAAEDTARADLNVDNGRERQDAATKSLAEIIEARDALQKLLDKQQIQRDEHAAEAVRDLNDAAKKQQEAADLMKPKDPLASDQPQTQQEKQDAQKKQEQANSKLRQALEQSEPLRDQKAQQTAQQLQNLIQKVEDLQKQQDANADQTQKQDAANQIQQKANEIAKAQEELNKDIQKTAEEKKDALQQANATPPNKDQQNDIVKNLDKNNLQQAHDQQAQAAQQLKQEAQQLKNQAQSNDLKPTAKQQEQLNKDQQSAQDAQNAQNQANQAADQLKQQAAQNAQPKADNAAIQAAKQAAQQLQKQAAALKPQNAAAQQQAQAAQQDAQAAEKAADQAAAAATPQEAQQDLNQAAQDLNKASKELADAANAQQQADKAQALAQQKQDAQAAADQAAAQAQKQDELAQATAADQAQLAQVQQNQQAPDQTAQQQQQIAQQAQAAQQQAKDLQQQAKDANNADVAKRAEQAQADLAQAQQKAAEAAKDQQAAAQDKQQAGDAANADQAKAAEKAAESALQKAAGEQQQASDALAKAEGELRNLATDMAKADGAKPDGADAGKPDAGKPDAGKPDAGKPDAGQPDAGQQAAQAAQEAAAAQQEAGQNADAAQQAANALAKAAQAMAKATPGSEPGKPGTEPGQEPGAEASAEPPTEPGKEPGKTLDSKMGISGDSAASVDVPGSVRDIGISADQWAKLPPLAKKDLMNAAQQNGPPAYRQMIKDYYVRIAKFQDTGAAAQ